MGYDAVLDQYIINLIEGNKIREQNDLQKLLSENGYKIPQATLSRRLKKLKIVKLDGIYQLVDCYAPNLPFILNIEVSDFGMIILHTHPGQASSLAYYIDKKYVTCISKDASYVGILGSIAGDDTVLVIVKDKASLKIILDLFYQKFPYLGK